MQKTIKFLSVLFPLTCGVSLNLITPNSVAATTTINVDFRAEIISNLALTPFNTQAGTVSHPADIDKFNRTVNYAIEQSLFERNFGEIIQKIGDNFLGSAYQAGMLDQSQQETLIVNLKQFDCVLFVETVLAMARGIAVQDYAPQTFVQHLESQRYRNGQLNGYCSRLHYFSEWILDNQKRGTVVNITEQLGGVRLNKTLNFMSQHRKSYPQLVSSDAEYQCMVAVENNLKTLKFNYIPTDRIHLIYNQLQPGDIIGIATQVPGLDFTHTGLVYQTTNQTGLIHASPSGAVKVSPDLESFVAQVEDAIGIVVARPQDPRKNSF